MTTIAFDMTQTVFIAILLLLLGGAIKKRVKVLVRWCIPGAVVGGLLFAILALILRQTGIIAFEFNTTLQQFFMNLFFTASGFGAGLALLKKGGKLVVIFIALAAALAFLQNVLAVSLGTMLGLEPMIALMTGSIPLTGGHGNAASFAPLAEEMGYNGAVAVATAAATFGLVSGALVGNPMARRMINKGNLLATQDADIDDTLMEKPKEHMFSAKILARAFNLIIIGLGIGSILFIIFQKILPNVTLPIHVMGMLGGVIVRLVMDGTKTTVPEAEIDALGDIFLGVFVSMAIFTMALWELIALAIPIMIILAAQLVLIYLFVRFITFNLMGRNYDAAVISTGHVGFSLGAVPVSMANMNALSEEYRYSKLAFFVVPVVGGLFSNFTNAAIITAFMNWCK